VLTSMFGEVLDGMLMNVWGRQTDITERKQVQSQVHRANLDLFEAYDATLEGWSHALEMRERETAGHSQRVAEMTLLLARTLGLSGETLMHIRRGALLHDIGKMGIPDSILLKPSPLSPDEWVVMRQHPSYAYQLLSSIPYLIPALDIPYSHHERWDGNGYPRGLRGEEIPLAARIFAVVDVWDALISNRPYRPAWAADPARRYLEEQAGAQFDPHIVESFLRMV
jgi:putative nucleotidyltransferase with HDIG domain